MQPETNNPDAEAQILLQSEANETLKSLDETAEGVLVETSKVKDAIEDLDRTMEAVVVNTSQPTKYVFEVNGAKVATLEGPQGEKGEKGDTPIVDYDLIVKKALAKIPKAKDGVSPVKGVDYFTEKDIADFIKDIKPLIKRWPKGDKGDTPKVDYDVIIAEILEQLPKPKNGTDGKDGSPDSADDIIKKIKGKLSYRDLKDKPDIGRGGSGLNTVATDGVTIAGTGLGDNPLRVIGGSGVAVDSVNGQTGVVVLDTGDIAEVTDKNYVTDADITNLGNLSGTNSGDVTLTGEDYLSLASQQITANPIDLDNLSATGTPDSSTFLRGDNTWATPVGSGDVSKVGTPVNNQIGVWTGDGTIEGDASLTFDTVTNTLATDLITATTVTANLTGNVTGNVSGSSGSTTGNAATVTTNANLTGVVTSVGNATAIADSALSIAKTSGLQTALDAKQATIAFGTGVQTALGVNIGSAGAPVLFNGALGTPSSGTVTNLTGTASININGTVGAATPTTATFTTATINTSLLPDANDGAVLGAAGTAFSDLFLAEGGVINWDSSDVTLIQTGNVLAVAGGDFRVATADVGTNADSVPTLSSTSTLTSKTLTSPVINTATIGGATPLAEGASIDLDPSLSADGKYTGMCITGTAGATLAFGDLIYLAVADSRWELADADAVTTSERMLGICVLAAASDGSATKILLHGNIRADAAFPTLTIGAPVYVGETAGDVQVAIPTGADNVIRRVGYALTADALYFCPSMDSQITVA